MAKAKRQKQALNTGRSADTLAMLLRTGEGSHGDRRTKRVRTRAAAKRQAISLAS